MQNPYFTLLRTAWTYARDQKKRFVLIYGMFVLANLVVAVNPLFYGWFIDGVQEQGAAIVNTAWIYAAGFLGLRLLEWSFHGPARVMERKLAFYVSQNFMEELYNKVLHLPVEWHEEHHSGSTISRLRKAYESLRDFFQQGFVYLYSIGKFVFSFSAMIYFSPLFGMVGVILGFITILIIVRFDKPFIASLREVNQREHHVSSTLFDSLSNIRTVITLKLEKGIREGFLAKLADVFPPFKRNVEINELKWFTAQMMVGLIYCVSVFGYVYQHWVPGEVFQIAGLIILVGYVNQFTSVFNDIASQYTQIVRFSTELQNVSELERAYDLGMRKQFDAPLPEGWKTIEVSNLNFSRKQDDPRVKTAGLSKLDIRIHRGQRIALIGESGSGKSTLLSLLRGLHPPEPGCVVSIDEREPAAFGRICGSAMLFPQEPEIFENSILYNITLGLPLEEDEVMRVCEEARFADVIRRLPKGLDTHIQEKGVNLSGGQKQRLALARGILAARYSSIVLMDEPTSSVDPRTESMIYEHLFRSFRNKTVISSLHRLHLLPNFDYIYILKDGAIVDEGTFTDLQRFSLIFQEMWRHQEIRPDHPDYPALNVAL